MGGGVLYVSWKKKGEPYLSEEYIPGDLLVMGDARLKERRREKIKKSLPFPPPFSFLSSQCGLPPGLVGTFFHKDTNNLQLDPTMRIIVC